MNDLLVHGNFFLDDKYASILKYYNKNQSDLTSFKSDAKLPKQIEVEISKVLRGSGNPRVLLNKSITFFNSFEPSAAKDIIFDFIKPKFHSQVKTLLTILGLSYPNEYLIEELDCYFYSILQKELL